VTCPVRMVSGDNDTVTPPASQRNWAKGVGNVTVDTGPFNHFDPFNRDADDCIAADIAFLRQHL
jgi:pimeloyl-ACP methyl ester carboxylesterase